MTRSCWQDLTANFPVKYNVISQVDEQTIQRLNDTQTVFLNVIGHFGWLLCRPELYIFRYAVFEAVYTLLIPLLAGALYWSIALRSESKQLEQALTSKLPTSVQRAQSVLKSAIRGRLLYFMNSTAGKVVMVTKSSDSRVVSTLIYMRELFELV
jgi:hypothetical protein